MYVNSVEIFKNNEEKDNFVDGCFRFDTVMVMWEFW
jgi:hypothetical protein